MSIPKNACGLGFRDVEGFNNALLAKVGWRLITKPESLLAAVLKAKYFVDGSFLNASVTSRPSHGWRSILEERIVLRKGLGWLIGDGDQIQIWHDDWLSTSSPERLFGPVNYSIQDITVSALLDRDQRSWNWNAIREIIPSYEDKIRLLSPGFPRCRDKLVWLSVRSRVYSTRSGYGNLCVQNLPITQTSFNWQANIWKLHTTPKIKMFVWKILINFLPVGLQLFRRGIKESFDCTRCHQPESIGHVLFSCEFGSQVWSQAPVSQAVGKLNLSLQDLIAKSKRFLPAPPVGIKLANLFVWVCWGLWMARNQVIFNNTHYSPIEVMTKTICNAKDWEEAQESQNSSQVKLDNVTPKSPYQYDFTVFVDAAWQAHKRLAGLGWYYQVPDTSEVKEHAVALTHLPSALSAEAQAIRYVLLHSLELSRRSLTVFSDSLTLVGLINSKSSVNELYGVLEEIEFLRSSFLSLIVAYIPRSCNAHADYLAKSALQALSLNETNIV